MGCNIVKHFIAIEKLYENAKLKEALDYWYLTGSRDHDNCASKCPIDATLLKQEEEPGLMLIGVLKNKFPLRQPFL